MRKLIASQKGVAAVEFALILPLLVMITFGIIELGIFVYDKQIITNASREGARAGIVASLPRVPATGDNSIESVVKSYCTNHLITFGEANDPKVNPPDGYAPDAASGDELRVEVTYKYSFLVLPNFITGFGLSTIKAVTTMRYE